MSSKVHSRGNVPFSWEKQPGVSKAAAATAARQDYHHFPPCQPEKTKISFHHNFQIPLEHAAPARRGHYQPSKLPPPPCPLDNSAVSFHHDLQIPLLRAAEGRQDRHHFAPPANLPPPPCPPENSRVSSHDLQIPLPPCTFQPPSRSSSRKGLKKIDDPFLIAYKEVTKSTRKGHQGLGLMKNMSIFSCKSASCGVAEDSVVRLSQLPLSRSRRDGGYNN